MDCVGFGFQVVVVERLGLTFTKEGLAWTRWCLGFWGRQRRREKLITEKLENITSNVSKKIKKKNGIEVN